MLHLYCLHCKLLVSGVCLLLKYLGFTCFEDCSLISTKPLKILSFDRILPMIPFKSVVLRKQFLKKKGNKIKTLLGGIYLKYQVYKKLAYAPGFKPNLFYSTRSNRLYLTTRIAFPWFYRVPNQDMRQIGQGFLSCDPTYKHRQTNREGIWLAEIQISANICFYWRKMKK